MMDSLTRFAMAQREIGLAIGEPPATRGYTPSVFAMLPRLLERAGTAGARLDHRPLHRARRGRRHERAGRRRGARRSSTATACSRATLAHRNHYPAIDVLQSVSRLAGEVTSPDVRDAAGALRETLAVYRAKEDLITIGAYSPGADAGVDDAIAKLPQIDALPAPGPTRAPMPPTPTCACSS